MPTDPISHRQQHNEVLRLTAYIASELNETRLFQDATSVRTLLSKLDGTLSVHFEMEENHLFPRLLQHENTQIGSSAKSLKDNIDELKEFYLEYMRRWQSQRKIQQSPSDFINETRLICDRIAKNIKTEEEKLFPLLEKVFNV